MHQAIENFFMAQLTNIFYVSIWCSLPFQCVPGQPGTCLPLCQKSLLLTGVGKLNSLMPSAGSEREQRDNFIMSKPCILTDIGCIGASYGDFCPFSRSLNSNALINAGIIIVGIIKRRWCWWRGGWWWRCKKNQYRIPFAAVVKTRERWERRGGGEVLRRV